MNQTIDKPLFTDEYDVASDFSLGESTILVHGAHTEDRHNWIQKLPANQLAAVHSITPSSFSITCEGKTEAFAFRSNDQIARFWQHLNALSRRVILDLTTLSYSVWGLLLRSGLKNGLSLDVCYTEPREYSQHPAPPLEGEIFDLSERTEGIRPLPGFASLHDELEDNFVLVALLGFEGARFAHVIEQTQPSGNRIVPVIGIPGFKPEFVFHTYQGNKAALLSSNVYTQVRYAPANCPFSLSYLLEGIAADFPQSLIKIALLGTKPHALGALLFERRSRRAVEFVYDHPIKKVKRTSGTARLLLYRVSHFLNV